MHKWYLNSEEIGTLVFSCHEFGAKFLIYFPDVSLIQKMHELAFDVLRFVKEHQTVDLFSEEEGKVSTMLLTWKVLNLWVFGRRIYS